MTDFPSIRDILDFWFLPLADPEHGKPRKAWFESTPEFDAEIRARFGSALERAIAGELDHWRRSPEGALALIVLCDQFPRNMHRRTARAYSGDPKALDTARFALAHSYPAAFSLSLRKFLFMPFHHSEQLADQQLACALFAAFNEEEAKNYALEHHDVVARFGRFPHRNGVLGRPCTPDELEYLTDAPRYGQ
jgi:uncharacterized protein (DUF924 family)